ncbi:MAG: NlpC/P60 family protein [Acidimicrobiales bacterium]
MTATLALVSVAAGTALASPRPALADQVSSDRAQAAQIVAQIQAEGSRLAVLSEQYDQDEIRAGQLGQQLSQTQVQISAAKAQVAKDQDQLRQQAVADYTSGGSSSGLDELFTSGGQSAAAVREYEQVASGDISGAIDRLNQADSVLAAQQTQLQATETQARATAASALGARQGAQAELATQQSTLSKVKGRIATLVAQQQAAEARAQAAAFATRIVASQRTTVENIPAPPPAAGDAGARAVAAAESQIGVPYRWAGSTPGAGFDCSGLTMWAWGQAGVSLSHSAAAQYDETVHVPLSDLQPGDLLFYDEGGTIGHVTMYVGPGEMIQAMETGTRIQITGIWTSGLVGAGRP